MFKVSPKHRALGRSTIELEVRKPLDIDLSIPVSFAPPFVNSLLGNGAGGEAQPSIPPNPQPVPISTGALSPNVLSINSGGTAGPSASTVPGSTPSGSSSPNSAKYGGNSSNVASALSPGSGGSSPVNVASGAPATVTGTLGLSSPAALALASLSLPQYSGSSALGTTALLPTITTAAVLPTKQLSGGAILGITMACLFFSLALILLLVRHRAITHRVELRRQWWSGRSASSRDASLVNSGSLHSPVRSSGDFPGNRSSARSSFATNFDHGLGFPTDSPSRLSSGYAPGFPPAAVIHERNPVLIFTGLGATAQRQSTYSMLSNGSGPNTQHLTISTTENDLEPSTLMSVRPFSPSESFAFPKPPTSPSSAMDSFASMAREHVSAQSSTTTLVHLSTPCTVMTDSLVAPVSTSLHPKLSPPSAALLPPSVPVVPSIVPLVDLTDPAFSDIEVVCRPFTPSLDDELMVRPDDRVRLLQIFDDGWAFVEKLAEADGACHERGLIPVDCLRDSLPKGGLAMGRMGSG